MLASVSVVPCARNIAPPASRLFSVLVVRESHQDRAPVLLRGQFIGSADVAARHARHVLQAAVQVHDLFAALAEGGAL